jgi:diguanylate cyclase (GGDEF)-like protein/PAS domain S-box-containing protein
MSNREQALRLLLVEEQLEQAEFLINHIRNGGIAVRPEQAKDVEDLEELIGQNKIDVMLANFNGANITLSAAAGTIKKLGKDIPLIAVVDQLNVETVLDALAKGARDVVLRDQPKHIQHVIKKEFDALLNRRAVRHIEADLRESERRCDALIESSRDPIAYIHDGMHIRANDSYLQMFGYSSFDELEGMPILDLVDSENQGKFKQIIKDFAKTKQCPPSILVTIQPENGEAVQVEFELSPASYDTEQCLQLVARPQMVDSRLTEQLRELKDRDSNTLLFNRKYFMAQLEGAVGSASSGKSNQAVLFIEPDQFEHRVRSLGLDLADNLLVEFAHRLRDAVGDKGVCCHYRDQSLAVVCTASSFEQTKSLAESIHKAFDNILLDIENHSVSFSVSVAAVQITEQNASVSEILSTASRLLQSMEGLGGNRFDVFDPNAGDRADAALNNAWKERIIHALAHDEFVLRYQPVINLMQEDDIHSYELAIRLNSPEGESVSPDHFLPIAQANNLIAEIDQWVVSQAISLLAERRQKGVNTQIFIKISPDSLQDNTLMDLISTALTANGVEGHRLILQLPESKVITRLKDIQIFKAAMKPLGVKLGLSQFGTSVDSLKMLSHIDADIIKIDRSFMEELDKNTQHQAKIREFVRHARDNGKATMAEFVSDASTVGILFSAGVDWVQGNFLSPPLTQMNYDFSS